MFRYAIRRLVLAVPTLLAMLTLVFALVRIIPGDPAVAALGNYASEEVLQAFRERMGLDAPLWQQYWRFMSGLLQGELGRSMITGRPIRVEIGAVLPSTVELTAAGVALGVIAGLPLGLLAAIRRNSVLDYVSRVVALVGVSLPAFYIGILLLLVFSLRLGWLPVISGGGGGWAARLRELALPAVSIALIMVAYVTRIARSSMLNVLREDYVRTARAKGLKERIVLWKHVLKNSMIPVITVVGMNTSVLLGSSAMVEMVFNRPGLGKLIIGAVNQRDYAMLQSLMVVYAALVVLINLLTDLSYAWVDPRIRYE